MNRGVARNKRLKRRKTNTTRLRKRTLNALNREIHPLQKSHEIAKKCKQNISKTNFVSLSQQTSPKPAKSKATKLKNGTFLSNNHNTLQSNMCDDICTNVTKDNNTLQREIESEIQRDEVNKDKEMIFIRAHQKYIRNMVHEVFTPNHDTECNFMHKSMHGRDKMVFSKRVNASFTEWKVNVDELDFERDKNKNNVIIGVQIMDKKRSITVYSNEKGMIFRNRKYIKRGLKIKSKSEMVIKIKYEQERIIIDFVYVKKRKCVQIDRKPIVIEGLNAFEYGVDVNIFVAQNENAKYGKYSITTMSQE